MRKSITLISVTKIVLCPFPPTNNNQTAYDVVARFEGDTASTEATFILHNGTSYDVCTTIQYHIGSGPGYRPSTNSTAITVMPQTTTGATTLMDMAAMQADAQTKGLQVWGPDSWSIFPPFFKLHVKVGIDWLGMNVHSWIGLFGWGIDQYTGLGRLLQLPLTHLRPEIIGIIQSSIIYAITVAITLYVTTQIAVKFTEWTPGYWITLAIYGIVGASLLTSFFLIPDANIARALLYGVGFALLAMLIGALSADAFTKLVQWTIQSEITGGEIVYTAVKGIINSFIGIAIASQFMNLFFVDPLILPFAEITAGLAAYAIWLGRMKT